MQCQSMLRKNSANNNGVAYPDDQPVVEVKDQATEKSKPRVPTSSGLFGNVSYELEAR